MGTRSVKDKKVALRKEIKKRLKNISPEERKNKSSSICRELLNLLNNHHSFPPFKNLVLGAYAPLREEVDICLEPLRGSVPYWAFPDIDREMMIFRQCNEEDLLETKVFGVELKTPPPKALQVDPKVILVPGLAFNARGERLGRGKGFYDRFLESFQGVTIGVCFDEQKEKYIPMGDHDIRVQFVVSESGILGN